METTRAYVQNNAPRYVTRSEIVEIVSAQNGRPASESAVFKLTEQQLKAYRIYTIYKRGPGPEFYEDPGPNRLEYSPGDNEVYANRTNKPMSDHRADNKAKRLIFQAQDRVVQFANDMGESITGKVPRHEELSWTKKEIAARAYKAGTADDFQIALLTSELDITAAVNIDTDLGNLADKIIASADAYTLAASQIAGVRRMIGASIAALGSRPTPEQINQVLEASEAAATARFQAFLASL